MPHDLSIRITQDPSDGFRFLPHLETEPPDLRVSFDVLGGDRIRARMSGTAIPALKGTEHKADLTARPGEVRSAAARLCDRWKELFVDFQPVDEHGRALPGRIRPYAAAADLSGEPKEELGRRVGWLARSGASLLFDTLLRGDDVRTELFRTYLAMALSREGLRIRFDSDLHLPWPMLCLAPEHVRAVRKPSIPPQAPSAPSAPSASPAPAAPSQEPAPLPYLATTMSMAQPALTDAPPLTQAAERAATASEHTGERAAAEHTAERAAAEHTAERAETGKAGSGLDDLFALFLGHRHRAHRRRLPMDRPATRSPAAARRQPQP